MARRDGGRPPILTTPTYRRLMSALYTPPVN
jgi:hypothetical protein